MFILYRPDLKINCIILYILLRAGRHVSCYKLLEAKGVERPQKGVKMKEKCKGCNKYDKKEDKCKRIGRNGKIGVCWFEEEY